MRGEEEIKKREWRERRKGGKGKAGRRKGKRGKEGPAYEGKQIEVTTGLVMRREGEGDKERKENS